MKKLIAAFALAISLLTLINNEAYAYEVKAGDTMSEIALAHSLTLQELAALNPQVANLNYILVGQDIKTAAAKAIAAAPETSAGVSNYEKDLLARLVRAEAEAEPYEGKVAVATVVLNRVANSNFPNTIKGVIYQRGQFEPVANGEIDKPADADSLRATNEALSEDRTKGDGSLFFYNPKTAASHWLDHMRTTLVIGNHVFKK
jgi:N-acetylmuramoyl-L-alanine amidase